MNVSAQPTRQNQEEEIFEVPLQTFQPWSTPVLKTKVPPKILTNMLRATDRLLSDKTSESHGSKLAGQIESEVSIPLRTLEEIGARGFLENMVREFVLMCLCQKYPLQTEFVRQQMYATSIVDCWLVSQRPDEYNPVHFHEHQVSAVIYLKKPKIKPSRKNNRETDGRICFVSPATRDRDLSTSQFLVTPEVGDFYLFGASQLHTVYPYRCYKGEVDTERRSVSFNARYQQFAAS